MNESIMVKLSVDCDSEFMGIKTYDRAHGSRGRFLVLRDRLSRLIEGPNGVTRYDSDCGHYAEVRRDGDCLWFRITWLSHYDNRAVKGFWQIFTVPMETVKPLLAVSKGSAKLLYSPVHTPASIRMSPMAAEMIRNFTGNKRLRRAFSKAMRDCFNWPGDFIMLHRDGEYSFYFTTGSGIPKCGGLILHKGEKGGHPYIYYSVHT